MKHKEQLPANPLWIDVDAANKEREEDFERDQLRKLVREELERYGLLVSRVVLPKNTAWRSKANEHILYGQLQGKGLVAREVLHQGSFKECCEVAAKLLDELDRSQELGT